MYDVARMAGVSVKTVSRVVNNEATVQQEYADRVLAAVVKLGFRRNEVARSLRSGRSTATVGLVIEDLSNPFYAQVAREIEQVARSHGTFLVTSSSEEDPARERELITSLCQRRVDGLIVVPTDGDHSYCRAEIDMGTPMVFLDRRPRRLSADTVVIDNRGGARSGAEALLARKHKRIAVIGHTRQTATMRERVSGVEDAIADAGRSLDRRLVRLGPLSPAEAAGEAADMLDGPRPPTAFFACNNLMTVGIVQELWRRGAVADVVGFDDVQFAEFFPQQVGLVTYDLGQLARRAAELLFERIRGSRRPVQHAVVPTRLIMRGRPAAAARSRR